MSPWWLCSNQHDITSTAVLIFIHRTHSHCYSKRSMPMTLVEHWCLPGRFNIHFLHHGLTHLNWSFIFVEEENDNYIFFFLRGARHALALSTRKCNASNLFQSKDVTSFYYLPSPHATRSVFREQDTAQLTARFTDATFILEKAVSDAHCPLNACAWNAGFITPSQYTHTGSHWVLCLSSVIAFAFAPAYATSVCHSNVRI